MLFQDRRSPCSCAQPIDMASNSNSFISRDHILTPLIFPFTSGSFFPVISIKDAVKTPPSDQNKMIGQIVNVSPSLYESYFKRRHGKYAVRLNLGARDAGDALVPCPNCVLAKNLWQHEVVTSLPLNVVWNADLRLKRMVTIMIIKFD